MRGDHVLPVSGWECICSHLGREGSRKQITLMLSCLLPLWSSLPGLWDAVSYVQGRFSISVGPLWKQPRGHDQRYALGIA